jgi:transposase
MEAAVWVGIDVSKARLDVAASGWAEVFSVANDPRGVAALVQRLQALRPALVVLEASGGLETALVAELGAAGLPVVVVNPRQVRDFARASGQLAKTDALDTRILALFAERMRPAVRRLPDAQELELKALVARRRDLVEMITAERNRLGTAPKLLRKEITAHIRWLEGRLKARDRDLDRRLRSSPLWRERENLLRGVPGVGPVTVRNAAGQPARTRRTLAPPDRQAGRGGAAQPRQRHAARTAHGVGRPRPGARRTLHGHPGRGALQPGAQNLLPAAAQRR